MAKVLQSKLLETDVAGARKVGYRDKPFILLSSSSYTNQLFRIEPSIDLSNKVVLDSSAILSYFQNLRPLFLMPPFDRRLFEVEEARG